jgi:valyl-tRNA synthetase
MKNSEGLIIQGCGGDLHEWIDGINELLTKEEILLDGTVFTEVSAFKHGELTNLLFHFNEDVHLNMGKLAMWRIASHATFGGTWLSDYVDNYLGGFFMSDYEKEIERLKKEEERLTKELARVNGMLANPNFVNKAPEAKLNEEKEKKAKYEQMMAQVEERLAQLS